jgi:hypothetical protein
MALGVMGAVAEKLSRVPEWLYYFSDEQFVSWCRQHKLMVCDKVRAFSDDERAAIFRYAERQQLVDWTSR